MRATALCAVVVTAFLGFPAPSPAQQRPAAAIQSGAHQTPKTLGRAEKINQNTVTVISGNPNGTYLYLAYDLSAVLDDGEELRVLRSSAGAATRTCWTCCISRASTWGSRNPTS